MEARFWHQKWARGEIGFHETETNPLLIAHFEQLHCAGGRVFVPLCGKTRDIAWLLGQGFRVAGVELSELAVNELFRELRLTPDIIPVGEFIHYIDSNIDIWVGDIFALSADRLGPVNAIYDRAALIALPAGLREKYASHLVSVTGAAPQLLVTLDYDQGQMDGPPFSIDADTVQHLYGAVYRLNCAESKPIVGGLKGKVASMETAWLLQPR